MMSTHMEKRDLLAVSVVLLVGVLFRVLFFRGLFAVDDFNYTRYAAEFWKGRYELGNVMFWHGTRPLIFVPISICFRFLGVSDVTAVAWPLTASLATLAAVYSIARGLLGRETAFYASLLAAMLPQLVDEATRVTPGPIINLVVAASVLLFLRAEENEKNHGLLFFISGFLFGMMPWAGRLGLLSIGFFPIAVLMIRRRRVLAYWPFLAGFISFIGIDILYQWMATGDPFFTQSIAKTILTNEVAYAKPFFYLKLMTRPLYGHAGVFFLAGLGAILAAVDRNRRAALFAAWLFVTWIAMEFGSSSITHYRPLFKEARFLSLLAIPGSITAGFALARIRAITLESPVLSRVFSRGTALIAIALVTVAAASVLSLYKQGRWEVEQHSQLQAVAAHVRAARGETIYVTHWLWNTRVAYFLGFDDDYFPSGYDPYHAVSIDKADRRSKNRYVQTIAPGEKLDPGILLHDEKLFQTKRPDNRTGLQGKGEIPSLLAHPPEEWSLMDRIEIGRNSVVAIYRIPGGRWPENNGHRKDAPARP